VGPSEKVRVRFAPSPTGHLHVGGARTALFNWLFARRHGGVFVLRIEDTDRVRSDQESFRGILEAMRWLRLDWDEGPGVGGPHGPYIQSERRSRYDAAADALLSKGKAYACTCPAELLAQRRKEAEDGGSGYRYEGTCRHRVGEPRPGQPHVLRMIVPDGGDVGWEDGVRGDVRFPRNEIEDIVLLKSDGFPTYNFAAVVDDAAMGVTDILRGDDHISNTPRQLILYDLLGAPRPRFAHLPMILGPDGQRLSKRHGASSVQAFRDEGILPEAMFNFLALLGWSPGDGRELFPRRELIEAFSLDRVSKGAATFNREKLQWMNGQYFRRLPAGERIELAREEISRRGVPVDGKPDPFWSRLIDAFGERFQKPADAWALGGFLFRDVDPDDEARERLGTWPDGAQRLERLAGRLESIEDDSTEGTESALRGLAGEMGLKAGDLIHPARIALTGRTQSIGIFDVMALLGREETVRRLRRFAGGQGSQKGGGSRGAEKGG